MTVRPIAFILAVLTICAAALPCAAVEDASDAPVLRVTVDAATPSGEVIRPIWNRLNIWDLSLVPDKRPFSFYDEVILMTATGGRKTNEMYTEDADGNPVYDFAKIDAALDKLIALDVKVLLVLGNMPRALSTRPDDPGAFDAGTGAPKDYAKYRAYITALFKHLIGRYSKARLEEWQYRLMTEPDNKDWWHDGFEAYQQIYDVTLGAMRAAGFEPILDVGNVMTPMGDKTWTEPFARWLASGDAPHDPAALPRIRNRFGFSCYGRGQMKADPRELVSFVNNTRARIAPHMPDALLSVDEGQILHDENGKYLWHGDGTQLGAAWNAAIFKIAHDVNLERYVQWDYLSDGLKSPTYNVIEMYERMRGDMRLAANVEGAPSPATAYVDVIAAKDTQGKVSVLLFHFDENRAAQGFVNTALSLTGLRPDCDHACVHYRVDRAHSNFFTQWLADSQAAGITLRNTGVNSGSRYDMRVQGLLNPDDGGVALWREKKPAYADMDELEKLGPDQNVRANAQGGYSMHVSLPTNSVSLLEFTP